MLMLLNSRSVMKGSLRDLIEVSVGQMRGFHPARQSLIRQTFPGDVSRPQADQQEEEVSS